MSNPIVFISRNHIKEGQYEALAQYYREVVRELEQVLPGTLMHLAYADPEGTRVTIVHVFPDADAMDRHMVGAGERTRGWSRYASSAGFEIYGTPSEATMQALRGMATALRVPLTVWPQHVGGYLRFKAG